MYSYGCGCNIGPSAQSELAQDMANTADSADSESSEFHAPEYLTGGSGLDAATFIVGGEWLPDSEHPALLQG